MKVLVVEDSAKLMTPLIADLREFGYVVDAVGDAAEAITHASDRDYDIIILDLMLPIESCLLVLHEIRELDREVEILILSTQDQIHDRVTALIQGADDCLVHPFSFSDLHNRIQALVKRKPRPGSPEGYSSHAPDTPTRPK